MLRSFFSAPAKSLLGWLLWAHILGVAIAGKTVDDADVTQITYSGGWVQCPSTASLCNGGQPDAKNGTWHTGTEVPGFDGDLNFNFTFTGTSVRLWFILAPEDADREENKFIKISVDKEKYKPVPHLQDSEPPSMYYSRSFEVKILLNEGHTLGVNLFKGSTLSFDFLVYENEDPIGSTNSTDTIGVTTVVSSSTNTTSTALIGSAPSPPRPPLRLLVGEIVSGVTVFILAIAGILWCCFKKNSRKGKSQCTAPLLAKLPPEPAPPKHKTMSKLTYDPPGYTEKNAYFGIQSLANSSSIGPTPQKGPLLP